MTTPLRTLIVDDERLARKRLRSLLADHASVEVVGEAGDLDEACRLVREKMVNLLFLDVQLSPQSGFDLLPQLGTPIPQVIFVTAHEHYAVRAFAVEATDYLMKPVTPPRLAEALVRAQRQCSSLPAAPKLVLQDGERVRQVAPAQIAALAAEGHYTRIHLADAPAMFVSHSLKTLAAQLPEADFLRLDRSLLINRSRIAGFDVQSRNTAILHLHEVPEAITLGRTALGRLRAALAE